MDNGSIEGVTNARFRATNAQDRAIGRIMLRDEVLGRTGIKHRPRDEEAEGASHQNRIERLAGIVKFSASRPAEPGQDAFDQFGRCPGSFASAQGRSSMQIVAGHPSGTSCWCSVSGNSSRSIVTSGCDFLSHKKNSDPLGRPDRIERSLRRTGQQIKDNKLPVAPAASFDK